MRLPLGRKRGEGKDAALCCESAASRQAKERRRRRGNHPARRQGEARIFATLAAALWRDWRILTSRDPELLQNSMILGQKKLLGQMVMYFSQDKNLLPAHRHSERAGGRACLLVCAMPACRAADGGDTRQTGLAFCTSEVLPSCLPPSIGRRLAGGTPNWSGFLHKCR